MSDQLNYFEKIDDFLLGHLDEQEAVAFRQKVEEDEALAKSVAVRKRLLKGMATGGRRKLKSKLKTIHQRVVPAVENKIPARQINWRFFIAAAAILLIGIVAWWMWTAVPPATPDQIFADNYQPFELALSLRNEDRDEKIDSTIQLYRKQQYAEAIPLIESLLQEKSNSQLQLALAISRFESGDKTTAFSPLSQIIAANDPFLTDQARWYSALFYLQLNQTTLAIPFLETLANTSDADKQKEAKEILSRLK